MAKPLPLFLGLFLSATVAVCAAAEAKTEAPAPSNEKLIAFIIQRAEALKSVTVLVEGAEGPAKARFVSADKNVLTVELQGKPQPIPWKVLRGEHLLQIAVQAAAAPDDLLLVARQARARGQPGLAEKLLDKILELDAARSDEVAELRRQWKPKEPPKVSPAATNTTPAATPRPPQTVPAGPWQNVGPGGGGAMYTPVISPLDPKLGLITCDMSGVYLTRDGGRHWRVLPGMRYGHGVAFSSSDPNVIFVGASDKLHRSTDAGQTWHGVTQDRQYPTCSCFDVLVDPDDGRFVWAAFGRGGEAGSAVNERNRMLVELSQDGGQKFQNASKGLPGGSGLVSQLAVDRATPVAVRTLYAATTTGLCRSRDGGANWERAGGKGLGTANLRQVLALGDKAAGKTALLVSGNPEGVWRSEDGGETFTPSGAGLSGAGDETGKGFVIEQMAAATNDPSTVYAIGTAFAKSTDGGKSWRRIFAEAQKHAGWLAVFKPWSHDGGRGVGCNPKNSKQVWFTGDMQFFASEDGGATLSELNSHPMPEGTPRWTYKEQFTRTPMKAPFFYDGGGLEVTFCYQVVPDPHRENVFYACYADIGTFRTEDAGKSWTYNSGIWNQGIRSEWRNSCYEIAPDPKTPGKLWGGFSGLHNLPAPEPAKAGRYFCGGVAWSVDGGQNWTPLEKSGLPDRPCTSVLLDKRNGAVYAAFYGVGVFRSQDDGKHFEPLNGGLPAEPLAWRLRQTPSGSIFLVCCCAKPGGVWKLDEAKSSWQRCDTGPTFADVRDAVILEGKDALAVAVEGDGGGVFASSDGGASWRKVLAGAMRSVDCSPDGKVWCAAGPGGLQRSLDGGTNWTPVRDFPFPFINDVTINPRNPGETWVGTGGCGVFKGF